MVSVPHLSPGVMLNEIGVWLRKLQDKSSAFGGTWPTVGLQEYVD